MFTDIERRLDNLDYLEDLFMDAKYIEQHFSDIERRLKKGDDIFDLFRYKDAEWYSENGNRSIFNLFEDVEERLKNGKNVRLLSQVVMANYGLRYHFERINRLRRKMNDEFSKSPRSIVTILMIIASIVLLVLLATNQPQGPSSNIVIALYLIVFCAFPIDLRRNARYDSRCQKLTRDYQEAATECLLFLGRWGDFFFNYEETAILSVKICKILDI